MQPWMSTKWTWTVYPVNYEEFLPVALYYVDSGVQRHRKQEQICFWGIPVNTLISDYFVIHGDSNDQGMSIDKIGIKI